MSSIFRREVQFLHKGILERGIDVPWDVLRLVENGLAGKLPATDIN